METWLDLEQRYHHVLSPRFRGWEIGAGWKALIEEVLHELGQQVPDVQVTQVKEKFGCLRVYTEDKTNDQIQAILRRAEARSAVICEVCGEAGNLLRDDGWVRVRCRDHGDGEHVP